MSTKTIGTLMIVGGIIGIGVFVLLLVTSPWYSPIVSYKVPGISYLVLVFTLFFSILMIVGGNWVNNPWTISRKKRGIEHVGQGISAKITYRGLDVLTVLLVAILITALVVFILLMLLLVCSLG